MDNKIIQLVKSTVDIRRVMEYYGIKFNRAGFAVCPFHTEKTASLSIKGQFYKCFGCGASGDVVTFVSRYFGITPHEAVCKLNNDFNINLPIGEKLTARQRYEADKRVAGIIADKKLHERKREALQAEYERAYDHWVATDKFVRENVNFSHEAEDTRTYAMALGFLPILQRRLEIAESRLNEFLKNERSV